MMTNGLCPENGGKVWNIRVSQWQIWSFDEVTVDTLVISTVSNWGAYAVEAYMQQLKKVRLLPSYKEIKSYLETLVRMGSVDGVTGRQSASVDGFPLEVEREILLALDVAASAGEARKAG